MQKRDRKRRKKDENYDHHSAQQITRHAAEQIDSWNLEAKLEKQIKLGGSCKARVLSVITYYSRS
jgi:hypothetical protein